MIAELGAADGLVEVCYRNGERVRLTLASAPLDDRLEEPRIGPDSVVLLTGGARGITAEIARALAKRHRPTLVLVGRTPLADEPAEIATLTHIAELRTAMIAARRVAGDLLTPALVEADCRRILRAREVQRNVASLRDAGARVEYLECDVKDADSFAALIDDVYARHGRIDGVVHGAGLIEDRLVADKHLDSLQRVIAAKAGSALTLARTLRPDSLRFLVLFSSVSGRFGNRGQADYAAASEMLAKLAQELDRRWEARVVSIDWGPWRGGGMVSAALEEEFARRGVALISPEVGCAMLEEEIARGRKGEAEVVIGAATGLSEGGTSPDRGALALLAAASDITQAAGGGITFVRGFELQHDRYLDDHRVDGRAVVPFAAAMELMAEAAVLAAPGRTVDGLREIRLLNGLTIPDEGVTTVRVAATPRPGGDEVEVVIGAPERPRPHYRSVAVLGESPDADPPRPLNSLAPFPMSVEDAYRGLLFHGPTFQGIAAIHGMDERGCTATLTGSKPEQCLTGGSDLRWLLDPVLIDSALQVQVLWARLQWDVTLLPAEIISYTRAGAPRDGEMVRHELRIRPTSSEPLCHADHWFYGSDGRLIATLGDVVGVGTQALNRLAAARA